MFVLTSVEQKKRGQHWGSLKREGGQFSNLGGVGAIYGGGTLGLGQGLLNGVVVKRPKRGPVMKKGGENRKLKWGCVVCEGRFEGTMGTHP